MITKGTTTIVRFYVTTTDGFPATGKASNITAAISIDGAASTAITDTISETDSINLPGWYEFEHTFNSAGNVFITFSCANCMIMPWEDDVVEISGGGGSGPSAADIALAVWSYEDEDSITCPYRSIRFVKQGNTYYSPLLMGYTGGYDILADYIWGFDPSTLLSTTSAAYRLVDIQDNAARPGDAMTLTAAYNAAKTASQFNAATDTVTINSTQVATLAAASDLDSVATKVELIKSKTDNLPTSPAATGDAMTLTSAYDAAKTASQFNAATDTVTINATQAATMVTATGFATPSDIPTSDIADIKTKVNSLHNTDLTGIATSSNVTDAQTAIIAAMPTIPTDYAKTSDLTGLSTFNAATDTVTINSTQAATMATATGFATPANITAAQTAIITHGDSNWTGGGEGGGATPKQIWEYSDRTLTAAPSSLATKTDVGDAADAVIAAIPDDYAKAGDTMALTADAISSVKSGLATASNVALLQTHGDAVWKTATGFSTFNASTDRVLIDTAQAATMATATGFATPSDITTAQEAIIASVPSKANIATAVWSDTAIYNDNTKAGKLNTVSQQTALMPLFIWSFDLSDQQMGDNTASKQIYTAISNAATSTDTAVLSEILKDLNAGVLNWSVTANALTTYNDNNTVRGTYTLTRDTEGNITRILPNS